MPRNSTRRRKSEQDSAIPQTTQAPGGPQPTTLALKEYDPQGNRVKRQIRNAVQGMVIGGMRAGQSERDIVARIEQMWPTLEHRSIMHYLGTIKRHLNWFVYGRSKKDLQSRSLTYLEGVMQDPEARPADKIAANREWNTVLGLHAPVRVEAKTTVTARHEHIHYVREVAQRDDKVRELMLQLGRRLNEARAVEEEAQSCRN